MNLITWSSRDFSSIIAISCWVNRDRVQGLLLHPSVGEMVDETAVIQRHPNRFATVDLAASGATIRQQLLNVVTPPPRMQDTPASEVH